MKIKNIVQKPRPNKLDKKSKVLTKKKDNRKEKLHIKNKIGKVDASDFTFDSSKPKKPKSFMKTPNEPPQKKKLKKEKKENADAEEYKPGSLSDLIQIKKFGKVVLPWDPNFGLDKDTEPSKVKKESEDEKEPIIKVNPLFDLSKRDGEKKTETGKVNTKLFVGNLPEDTLKMNVKNLFKKCGLVKHIKLVGKKNASKTVTAIVTFDSEKSCEAALKMNGKVYQGRHLRVNSKDSEVGEVNNVFVGNIPYHTLDEDLWKAFEQCGDIENVRIIRDARTGKGKGFGFVNFKSEESLSAALELNGKTVLGRQIRVESRNTSARSRSNTEIVKRKRVKKNKPESPKKLAKTEAGAFTVETGGETPKDSAKKKIKKLKEESTPEVQTSVKKESAKKKKLTPNTSLKISTSKSKLSLNFNWDTKNENGKAQKKRLSLKS